MLADLRPAYHGFAGIAQETRLLFAMLSRLGLRRLGGLASGVSFRARQPPMPADPFARAVQQARLLIAQDSGSLSVRGAALLPAGLRGRLIRRLAVLAELGGHETLDQPIDPAMFGDWLWMTLFDRTLPPGERGLLERATFYATQLGYENARHLSFLPARFQRRLATDGWDVFLSCNVSPYRVSPGTRPIVRYYDALPILSPHTVGDPGPHLRSHATLLARNMQQGASFVCASEPVRQDLLRLFPTAERRVTTIPVMLPELRAAPPATRPAVRAILDQRASDVTGPARPAAGEPRLVLAVATLEPRKNYPKLFQAFGIARQMLSAELRLVVVGNPGWRSEAEVAQLRRLVAAGAAHHVSGLSADELRVLYHAAHCVVAPSRAEGFDYAGVEAMQCGTAVLASDTAVHRWVYGDAARYFDAYDAGAQGRLIADVCAVEPGEGELAGLRERGLRQAGLYVETALRPRWEALLGG